MTQKPRIFRLFVSSTFSDMVAERNLLQAQVFPKLRRFCEARGARFQAIDLRWGISAEAGLNQRATDLCLSEIARSQRVTRRPNFLLLLGDRYGWQPLPDDIPAEDWNVLTQNLSTRDVAELKNWYWRDDNAVPSVHILQPRYGEYTVQRKWNSVEARLRSILLEALSGLNWSHERRLRYEASVTEQEIEAGIFQYEHAQEGTFCFFRSIDRLPPNDTKYRDAHNVSRGRLTDLKSRLQAFIPDNIQSYTAAWANGGIAFDEVAFCKQVGRTLTTAIEAELATFEESSSLEIETEAHRVFLREHTHHFIGRVDVLDAVARYLASDKDSPLVLHGQSGVGKSTVMAKAISTVSDALYRFIGITPETSNIRSLLANLCEEIGVRYEMGDAPPQDYEELINKLPLLLSHATADKPLVIFLDALDHLDSTNMPNDLRWLPRVLPAHVKLVLSTTPGAYLDALKHRLLAASLIDISTLEAADGEALLDQLLRSAGRTLQSVQHAELLSKFSQSGLPLYLKLAFEEAKLWRSYTDEFNLEANVPRLLEHNLFARLSNAIEHGAMLVSRSLAYLQAARNGLSEDEMLDVLWTDADFKADFEARSHRSQRDALKVVPGLPTVIWSRLYFDLEPYLVERSADGSVLLAFYHRQFSETVDRLYLAPQREARHGHLAEYFRGQELCREGQPNRRKVAEQAYQQAKAGQIEAYGATLIDYPYLQACLDVRGVQALIEDCELLPRNFADLPMSSPKKPVLSGKDLFKSISQRVLSFFMQVPNKQRSKIYVRLQLVGLIRSALLLSREILVADKRALAHQLHARLSQYALQPEIASLRGACEREMELVPLNNGRDVLLPAGGELIATLGAEQKYGVESVLELADGRILSWGLMKLRLWGADGATLATLEGHTGLVKGALELTDGRILSWGDDQTLRLWGRNDVKSTTLVSLNQRIEGARKLNSEQVLFWCNDNTLRLWCGDNAEITHIEGHTDRVTGAIELQNRRILSWSHDTTLRLWSDEGTEIAVFRGHTDVIEGVIELADGRILSWSRDATLRLWNSHGAALTTLEGHTGRVDGAIELRDGRILSWSRDATLRLWNGNGEHQVTLKGHKSGVYGAVELANGRLVSWGSDLTLKEWKPDGTPRVVYPPDERVYGAVALHDGRLLSWNGDGTLTLKTMDARVTRLAVHTKRVLGAIELKDSRILSWSEDGTLRLWKVPTVSPESGTTMHAATRMKAHEDRVIGVMPLMNGLQRNRELLSWSKDKSLQFWMPSGHSLARFTGHTEGVRGAIELKDGRILSWSEDKSLRLWEPPWGRSIATFWGHDSAINGAIELSDGRFLSWSDDKTLRLWSPDGTVLARLMGHTSYVRGALELSDGRLLSWASDKTPRLWTTDGATLTTLDGHVSTVRGALELKDGRILSWSEDKTLRLWNPDGTSLGVLKGHTSYVIRGQELKDGRLVSLGIDGWLRLWIDNDPVPTTASSIDIRSNSGGSYVDAVRLIYAWATNHNFAGQDLFPEHPAVSSNMRAYYNNNTIFVYETTSGQIRSSFVCDAAITCIAVYSENIISAGDEVGRVLLLRWIPKNQELSLLTHHVDLESEILQRLAHEVGFHQIALNLAVACIRHGMDPADWLVAYQQRRITQVAQGDSTYEQRDALETCFGLSVDNLIGDERSLYYALGIFAEGVQIPNDVVKTLWGRYGLSAYEFDEFLTRLIDLDLLDKRANAFVVQSLFRKHLVAGLGEQAVEAHLKLIEVWGDPFMLPHEFAWLNYGYHLVEAGQKELLRELLLDYRWLRAKLAATEINALISDFDLLPYDRNIYLVKWALIMSRHILQGDKGALAHQLHGRLYRYADQPEIALLRATCIVQSGLGAIDNGFDVLLPAAGVLTSTLVANTPNVRGALDLNDGRLLSWHGNGTLHLWKANGVLSSIFAEHTSYIQGAIELRDGRVLSWSGDGTSRLWKIDGRPSSILAGHELGVDGVLELRDRRLLSWGGHNLLRLWDADGTYHETLVGHSSHVQGALELIDGRLLSWSVDQTLRLWNADGTPLTTLAGHTSIVRGALELRDGRLLSWSEDHTLRLWGADGTQIVTLLGHTQGVLGALELTDGKLLSWGSDGVPRLWNSDGTLAKTMPGHSASVVSMLEIYDGQLLSCSGDRTLRIWSANGTHTATLIGHTQEVIGALDLSDGQLLSWSYDRTLRLWKIDGTLAATLEGHTKRVSGALDLRDNRSLSWSEEDGTLRLWDLNRVTAPRLAAHTAPVKGILLLQDGRLLSWSYENTVRIWGADGETLTPLVGHTSSVNGLLAMVDGRLLSWGWDNTLRLWNTDGTPAAILVGHTEVVNGALELRDGRILSWGGNPYRPSQDKALRLWSANGTLLETLVGHMSPAQGALELRDGRLLSWGGEKSLRLWDTNGMPITALVGHSDPVNGALELSDGRLLSWSGDPYHPLRSSSGNTLRLWDPNGVPLVTFAGHTDMINGAMELGDGRLLSWSGKDGTIRLWDTDGTQRSQLNLPLWGEKERIFNWSKEQGFDGNSMFTDERMSASAAAGYAAYYGDTAYVYNPSSGKTLARFNGDMSITCIAATADGLIAIGDEAGRIIFLHWQKETTSPQS